MSKDDDNSIFDELDSRLDDFFAEDDLPEENTSEFLSDDFFLDVDDAEMDMFESGNSEVSVEEIKTENNAKSPLDSLKAIVLEMDWEISDENLSKYLGEIDSLKKIFSADKAVSLLLKLHTSIGKYMFHKKAAAHPDALKFLYQIYNSLEKVITKSLSDYEKNKTVLNEITNFKNLKARMFPDKYKSVKPIAASKPKRSANKPDFSNLPDDIQREINDYIEREITMKIEALKKELTRS